MLPLLKGHTALLAYHTHLRHHTHAHAHTDSIMHPQWLTCQRNMCSTQMHMYLHIHTAYLCGTLAHKHSTHVHTQNMNTCMQEQTRTHTHSLTPHTHTHTHTRVRAHTHTHARMHAHTHTCTCTHLTPQLSHRSTRYMEQIHIGTPLVHRTLTQSLHPKDKRAPTWRDTRFHSRACSSPQKVQGQLLSVDSEFGVWIDGRHRRSTVVMVIDATVRLASTACPDHETPSVVSPLWRFIYTRPASKPVNRLRNGSPVGNRGVTSNLYIAGQTHNVCESTFHT